MNTLTVFKNGPRTNKDLRQYLNERENWVRSIDSLFDDLFKNSFGQDLGVSASKGAYPKCNIVGRPDHVEITAELAGFTKKDVEIEVEDNVLTISGKFPQDDENTSDLQDVYYLRELKRSAFRRSFQLSDAINSEKIAASFDNGLLTITLPRHEEEIKVAKKINIK
ncbi:MAG: Hsp20/alpha crystallin family protein [Pseudomonadales bacterium]|jgi:HSP20 family protein